jgi:hypothetical protein
MGYYKSLLQLGQGNNRVKPVTPEPRESQIASSDFFTVLTKISSFRLSLSGCPRYNFPRGGYTPFWYTYLTVTSCPLTTKRQPTQRAKRALRYTTLKVLADAS